MKRSEINALIQDAKRFFEEHKFHLPPWAHWTVDDWKRCPHDCSEIFDHMLGWDITDFGSGDFAQCGLLLFTIRNGALGRDGKTYAEKIMIVRENQVTPTHFHWNKMEDIINRGGGNLVLELHSSDPSEQPTDAPVSVSIDGIVRMVAASETVTLTPGESITLTPFLYHKFYGESGRGKVLVGEVSKVNDDAHDNRFHEPVGRFPDIEEDEAPLHLLVSDYARFLN